MIEQEQRGRSKPQNLTAKSASKRKCGHQMKLSESPAKLGVLLDNIALPKHDRTTQLLLGQVVGNVREDNASVCPVSFGFNVTRSDVPVGNMNAMHLHRAPEIFIISSGEFNIRAAGGHVTRLRRGDFAVVPAAVERCFECVLADDWCSELQEKAGNVVTVLPGESWVQWADSTIKAARDNGANCNDFGVLLGSGSTDAGSSSVGGPCCIEEKIPSVQLSQGEFEASIHRVGSRAPAIVPFQNGEVCIEVLMLTKVYHFDGGQDVFVLVLQGQVVENESLLDNGSFYVCPQGDAFSLHPTNSETAMVLIVRSTVSSSRHSSLPLLSSDDQSREDQSMYQLKSKL